MSLVHEQFSAAGEAQLDAFRKFSAQACERAARLATLNIDAGRATVDSAAKTLKQLADAREPGDLLALASAPQHDLARMMAYGRELFSIVAGVQAGLLQPADTATAAPATEPHAPAANANGAEPLGAVMAEAAAQPVAAVKPLAEAAGLLAGTPPAATAAASMPETPEVVTHFKPTDALPPAVSYQQDSPPPRRGNKKR